MSTEFNRYCFQSLNPVFVNMSSWTNHLYTIWPKMGLYVCIVRRMKSNCCYVCCYMVWLLRFAVIWFDYYELLLYVFIITLCCYMVWILRLAAIWFDYYALLLYGLIITLCCYMFWLLCLAVICFDYYALLLYGLIITLYTLFFQWVNVTYVYKQLAGV